MSDTISTEQREILRHTKWVAHNRMYCGAIEDPDLQALCAAGLMREVSRPLWIPDTDAYFTITAKGTAALKAHESKAEAA